MEHGLEECSPALRRLRCLDGSRAPSGREIVKTQKARRKAHARNRRAFACFQALSERELQLIPNHAAAAFRELRMEELTVRGREDVSRHARAARRERADAGGPVLRVV